MRTLALIIGLFLVSICADAGMSFAPVVEIVATDAFADESHTSSINPPAAQEPDAIFVVSRACCTTESLTVRYALSGTASNGNDYIRLSGSVIIPPGRRTARLIVRAIDDQFIDRHETVVVTLKGEHSYRVGQRSKAKATIMDSGFPIESGGGFTSPGGSPFTPLPPLVGF